VVLAYLYMALWGALLVGKAHIQEAIPGRHALHALLGNIKTIVLDLHVLIAPNALQASTWLRADQ
jgi:type II secretory pathway component PulM